MPKVKVDTRHLAYPTTSASMLHDIADRIAAARGKKVGELIEFTCTAWPSKPSKAESAVETTPEYAETLRARGYHLRKEAK